MPSPWSISKIEDTGVGAYLGQVAHIQSGALLGAAASIYAVEALHTTETFDSRVSQ